MATNPYLANLPEAPTMGDLIKLAPDEGTKVESPLESANVSSVLPGFNDAVSNLGDATTIKDTETVGGQLISLLDRGGGFIQQARERGKQFAAERGLVNTSLAAQAGESSAISAALPIAAQDASTYAQAARQYQAHLEMLIAQGNAGDVNAQLMLQEAGYNRQLSAQAHAQRTAELATQGDVNARLQLQNAQHVSELQKQGYSESAALQAQASSLRLLELIKQGDINMALQDDAQAHQRLFEQQLQGNRIELSNLDFQHTISLNNQLAAQALNLTDAQQEDELERINLIHANTIDTIGVQSAADATRDAQLADYRLDEISAIGDEDRATAAVQSEYRLDEIAATGTENRLSDAAAAEDALIRDEAQAGYDTAAAETQAEVDAAAADELAAAELDQIALEATEERITNAQNNYIVGASDIMGDASDALDANNTQEGITPEMQEAAAVVIIDQRDSDLDLWADLVTNVDEVVNSETFEQYEEPYEAPVPPPSSDTNAEYPDPTTVPVVDVNNPDLIETPTYDDDYWNDWYDDEFWYYDFNYY